MPSVVRPIHKRGKRSKRGNELRAAKVRAELKLVPIKRPPRFPYQALEGDQRSDQFRARGKYLDILLRSKLGLELYEVKGAARVVEATDGSKDHRGGSTWDAKLLTKRKHEPRHEGPRQ